MTQPLGDQARDERELTQLVKDLNKAVVKADVAVLERVLHEDYVHHRPRGMVETRAQYLENRKARRVDFESLVPDEIKVRVYGDTAIVTVVPPPRETTNTGRWMSSVAGPACSFGGTGAGSSFTSKGHRCRSPEGAPGPQRDGPRHVPRLSGRPGGARRYELSCEL
jgi:hypothetical protein